MDNNQDPKPQPINDPGADPAGAAPTPPASPEQSADAVPPADAAPYVPPAAQPVTDRLFRLRSVIAVAAAGVVLGAAGGATVTALVDGDHDRSDHSYEHREQGDRRPGMPPGGQLPGGTVPEDGTESDAPAAPGDTSTS